MTQAFEFLKLLVIVGGFLLAVFMILLAMPKSKFRDFLRPIIGICFALLCGAYVISPVDVLPEIALGPFGLIDDLGVLIAGVSSARMALRGGKD